MNIFSGEWIFFFEFLSSFIPCIRSDAAIVQ